MVLELLIGPRKAEHQPWQLFFIGFMYCSIALFLSIWVFEKYTSLVMVFLTVMACTHLMHSTFRLEEKKDFEIRSETTLLEEHGKALSFMMFLFLGFVVAFSLWYILLPSQTSHNVFSVQIETIEAVNSATQPSGSVISKSIFLTAILMNNLKVLFFCMLFAVFYGAGAIFILAWNASVVGAAMGSFVRSNIALIASEFGMGSIATYFSTYSLSLLRYLTHGALEILAYFMAALAAGIISIAIARRDYESRKFKYVILDTLDLAVLSVVILVIAAFVEVFITPVLF